MNGHMAKTCKTTRKSKNKVYYSEARDADEEEYVSSSAKVISILPKQNDKTSKFENV